MQPIPAQDRPKLIAVVIGIVIALVLVVRNLIGTQTLAQPREEEKLTTNTAPAPPTEPADRPAQDADGSAEAGDIPAADEGSEAVELPLLHDPFQPIEKSEPASVPAASAPAAVAAKAPVPVLPSVMPAPARPAEIAFAVRSRVPMPPIEPVDDRPTPPPTQAAEASAAPAPAAPAEEVRLVGTVRQSPSAVAVFRTSERAVFLRPKEVISHWRVVRIEDGEVTLSHNNTRELVHVGEMLPPAP
jgi:hypothetical protein